MLQSGVMVLSSHRNAAKTIPNQTNERRHNEEAEEKRKEKNTRPKSNTKRRGRRKKKQSNTHTSMRWANNRIEYRTTIPLIIIMSIFFFLYDTTIYHVLVHKTLSHSPYTLTERHRRGRLVENWQRSNALTYSLTQSPARSLVRLSVEHEQRAATSNSRSTHHIMENDNV